MNDWDRLNVGWDSLNVGWDRLNVGWDRLNVRWDSPDCLATYLCWHEYYKVIVFIWKSVPIKLSNNKWTLIDNFQCKLTECTLDTTAGVLINNFSDHQHYFIIKYKNNPLEDQNYT